MADKKPQKGDDKDSGQGFDMYRFFSRWDVIAMIVFIIAMLLIILYQALTGGNVAA